MSEPDFPPPREFCGDRLMGFRASWREHTRVQVGRTALGFAAYDDRVSHHQGWFLSGFSGPSGGEFVMVLPDDASKPRTLYAADVSLRPVFQTQGRG
jgi:hypothetical protein